MSQANTYKKYISSDSILINDRVIHASDLPALLHNVNTLENWERDVYLFLQTWFDNSLKIKVKTSGSTSAPKTIWLQKKHMVASALVTGKYLNLNKGDKALLCLPAKYIAGKMMLVRSIVLGLQLYIQCPSSSPTIDREFDFVAMTPMQVTELIRGSTNALTLIRKLIIGGGAISSALDNKLKTITKPDIYETYGMTETITHIAMRMVNGKNKGSSFHAISGVEFQIDKRDCLMITARHLDIFHMPTNDVVRLISSSEFEWKGRWDHLINTGGLKANPEVLEHQIEHLLNIPFFMAGIPDDQLGEKIVLFIQMSHRDFIKKEALIIQSVNLISPKHFIPKEIISLFPFIFTPTGKINRTGTLQHHGYIS